MCKKVAVGAGLFILAMVVVKFIQPYSPPPSLPGTGPVFNRTSDDFDVIAYRLDRKRQITKNVIDDEISLVEATAAFGRLNRLSPAAYDPAKGDWIPAALTWPVATEEDRLCRQVYNWVSAELKDSPDAEAVLGRLNREYMERLESQKK
jgi:hypothetical protein